MDRDEEQEEMMNKMIAGDGDHDYSSQFLNLEEDDLDGSGEAPEGEDDGSGSRTLVITKTSDVY